MHYDLTIIVPVYNEEDNIERLEKELRKFLCLAIKKTKILFINDGSKDNSQALIESICKRTPHFYFISFAQNKGLSTAIKAGFDHADTELIGYIDSDLQTSPEDFNILIKEIDNCELVTGVRYNRKDSFVKNVSSTIANRIRRAFTHDGMDDTGCPLKIIKADFAKKIPMFNGLHRFLPAMILLRGRKNKTGTGKAFSEDSRAGEIWPLEQAGRTSYGLLRLSVDEKKIYKLYNR